MVINCWHINEHESDAMWKIYLDSAEGVAIQSTFERLEGSIKEPWNEHLIVRPVKYLNYEKNEPPSTNALDPFFCKRKAFEHEKELRAMITLFNENPTIVEHGLSVPVDLNLLIEMVHISPKAPIWFSQMVQKLLIRYELKVQIKNSNLFNAV